MREKKGRGRERERYIQPLDLTEWLGYILYAVMISLLFPIFERFVLLISIAYTYFFYYVYIPEHNMLFILLSLLWIYIR